MATSSHDRRSKLLLAIEEAGFPVPILMDKGWLQIVEGMEDPAAQASLVDQFMRRAQREGTAFRLLGDMIWTQDKGWDLEQIYTLEKKINRQRENCPSLFLCQYDINKFTADIAFMAMQTHNFIVYNDRLNHSPYFDLAKS
ncbi:MAG: MEDS domain-containing protein [Desulfarculaceae bacterium]|nr:MEDS domain-containing protein [Desulfarculaceae bacterium]